MSLRQKDILGAAERLFRHYGITKTTVADIAREAGVGVGTVYLDFPSKDAIAEALAHRERAALLARLDAVLSSDGSYGERLIRFAETRQLGLRALAHQGPHGRDLLGNTGALAALDRHIHEREAELLADFLAEGRDDGAFSVGDPALTARTLLAAYDGVCPALTEGPVPRDELASLHAVVLGGVLQR
jgi:AcrR family transcriptional regulator